MGIYQPRLASLCAAISQNDKPAVNAILERMGRTRSARIACELMPLTREYLPWLRHRTALELALHCGDPGIVLSIYHLSGLSVNRKLGQLGMTPLHVAAGRGARELVRGLIDMKASVNARDAHGTTPLAVACATQDAAMVLLLLRAGADPAKKNDFGEDASDIAAKFKCNDAIMSIVTSVPREVHVGLALRRDAAPFLTDIGIRTIWSYFSITKPPDDLPLFQRRRQVRHIGAPAPQPISSYRE